MDVVVFCSYIYVLYPHFSNLQFNFIDFIDFHILNFELLVYTIDTRGFL